MPDKLTSTEAFALSAAAACVSKTVIAPLSSLKTRMQIATTVEGSPKYNSSIDCFQKVVNKEGWSALWRGNCWDCVRYFPVQALNIWSSKKFKNIFIKCNDEGAFMRFSKNVVFGAVPGGISLFFLYPFDIGREIAEADHVLERNDYDGTIDAMQSMIEQHGLSSLWRGFATSVAGVVVYRATYFTLYDIMKPQDGTYLQNFVVGYCVTIFAGLISYPIDTIRRRQMICGNSFNEVLKSIWETSGIAGFYQGVGLNIFRGLFGSFVMIMMDKVKRAYIAAKYG